MSRIGKVPIIIKEGITLTIQDKTVKISGPKGSFNYLLPDEIETKVANGKLIVSPKNELTESVKPIFGLVRATLANMIKGVFEGFEKKLELSGVGYRASVSGNNLMISVGFSHPVEVKAPENIKFSVAENVITVSGTDKTLVGDMAAKIRAIRPPEPYKGKGIKYLGEHIRRKVGKATKALGAK